MRALGRGHKVQKAEGVEGLIREVGRAIGVSDRLEGERKARSQVFQGGRAASLPHSLDLSTLKSRQGITDRL